MFSNEYTKHGYFVMKIIDSPLPPSSVLRTSPLERKYQSLEYLLPRTTITIPL